MASTTRRKRPQRTRPARKAARPVRKARRKARRPRPARRKARALPKKLRRKTAARRRVRVAKNAKKRVRPRARGPKAAAKSNGAGRRRGVGPSLLDRSRRQLPDVERMARASGMADEHLLSAARAGHDDMRIRLQQHTDTSPALTAGDPDARWEDAASVGDEAPGGDNPTPDQDRVDDIGKALGIQYRTDEELQGGDEVAARDRRRWELDPASSDDWPHDKKKR